MKKGLVVAVAAALLLVLSAPAGAHTHAQLHTKLASLQKQINALKTTTANMRADLRCIRFMAPVSVYGDQDGGYVFDNNDGQGPFFTSALDIAGPGEVPDAWFVVVDPACAPSTARAQASTHRRVKRAEGVSLVALPTHKTRGE